MIQTGDQFRAYIERELETKYSQNAVFFGIAKANGAHGVVAIDNYTKRNDCELSYCGMQFFSRALFVIVFRYIFATLKCHRCTSRITADNDKAIQLAERFGFVHEGTLREACDGKDVLIHGLLKSECRWIRDGQKIGS